MPLSLLFIQIVKFTNKCIRRLEIIDKCAEMEYNISVVEGSDPQRNGRQERLSNMMKTYLPQYKAEVRNDILNVRFWRLFDDVRDVMSDDPRPDLMALDDFKIEIDEIHTKRTTEVLDDGTVIKRCNQEKGRVLKINTKSKRVANYIWWVAKIGATFDDIKALEEAKQFK